MTIIHDNPYTPPPLSAATRLLLQTFGHTTLGDGDEIAGMNTLVSMCLALSAAAGPEAGVVTDDDTEFSVGLPWLVSGSLSRALHEEHVISPLRETQNVLTENVLLAQRKMPAAQDAKKPASLARLDPDRTIPPFNPELLGLTKDRMLLDSLMPNIEGERDYSRIASTLLERGALQSPAEFYARAGFFHEGTNHKALSHQLQFTHRGYPLVDFPMATSGDAVAAGTALLGIIEGRGMLSALPLHVRGIATARMSTELHGELLADSTVTPWMNRMLWLMDMPAASLLPLTTPIAVADTAGRFRLALHTTLALRLGEKPAKVGADSLLKAHHDFHRHVATLETTIPGISGSLRTLVPTLYFGLAQLLRAAEVPNGFTWHLDGVGSLAADLANRMAHAHMVARGAEDMARRQRFYSSIPSKLADRPDTERGLIRRHNKLPTRLCREVLADLEASGRVFCDGGVWHLAPPSTHSTPSSPVIDVP